MPPLVRARTARACDSSTAHTGHATGSVGSCGDRGFDQGRGGLLPLAGNIRGYLGKGDGLD